MNIHFWTLETDIELASILDWNPDEEPTQYSSGIGHNIYELAIRLRNKGHKVTLGKQVPRSASLLVVFKKDFIVSRKNSRVVSHSLTRPVIHIRSDLQFDLTSLFKPDIEVVSNRKLVLEKNQRYLPPLPQRGLKIRNRGDEERLTNICIKSNPQTFPKYLEGVARDAQRSESTQDLVFIWDVPSESDGSNNNWNDFSEVDVTLVLRNRNIYGHDDQRKPPTRLINAWLAETIPFIDPIDSYLELATDGVDAIVINQPSEILKRITEINNDLIYRKELIENVKRKAVAIRDFNILNHWENLFEDMIMTSKITLKRALIILGSYVYNSFKNILRQRLNLLLQHMKN